MNMNLLFGASGLVSGGPKIKASVSGNPVMDRESVGIGVQSSSVMNMNLGFGVRTYIRDMKNGSAEIMCNGKCKEFVCIVDILWVSLRICGYLGPIFQCYELWVGVVPGLR